jgi:hypothetical protein
VNKNLYNLRIKNLELQSLGTITITLSDGSKYTANLNSDFSQLFCYPKDMVEWQDANIVEGAFAIEWKTGFDIHFDQIVAISLQQKIAS